uniref:START domain-containing protein n=1 Tax=Parascaris equorum TaxID=6256 RepID=A0A914RYE3_PAREQ
MRLAEPIESNTLASHLLGPTTVSRDRPHRCRTWPFTSTHSSSVLLHRAITDFLDVRRIHLDTDKNVYEGWYVSVDSSVLPANSNKKMVRGFNGPNLVRVSGSSTTPDTSVFEWMLSSDVKGDIPRRLIERTMSSFLLDYVKNLRNFISDRASEYP